MFTALFTARLEKRKAMALVFVGSSIWGLLWIPLRWLDAVGYVGLWSTFAFMVIPVLPFLIWRGRMLMIADKSNHFAYILTGGFVGLGFALYCTGLIFGSVTKTTLLFYLTPVWSSLLGMMLLGERGSIGRWIANAMGIGGCSLILGINSDNIVFDHTDWFGFLSGLPGSWHVGLRRFPEADFVNSTLMQYVFGTIMVGAAIYLSGCLCQA